MSDEAEAWIERQMADAPPLQGWQITTLARLLAGEGRA